MPSTSQALASAVKYHQSGDLRRAEQIYRQILKANPRHVDTLHLFGLISYQLGQPKQAIEHMGQALRLNPNFAEAHNNLGIVLQDQGQVGEAIQSYRRALQLHPHYADAYNNLGTALTKQGQEDEAVAAYEQAIRLKPDYAEAHNNLGVTLAQLGKFNEAMESCQQALHYKPNYAEAYYNLANALRETGRAEEAIQSYQQALKLRPNYAEAHSNLGSTLGEQGRLEEAIDSYEHALRLKPEDAEVHWNQTQVLLLMGNYEKGWDEYEWRQKTKDFSPRSFRQPLWDGSSLEGRRIFLHAEQGLGDALQFCRYAPLMKQRGGFVIMECSRLLVRLMTSLQGVDQLITPGSLPPDFDVYAPMMSLPRIFGTSMTTIPADIPYLAADTDLKESWRRELGAIQGFKIGIAWQGNPKFLGDRRRSIPLIHYEPLARVPGVRLFNLQKEHGLDQLRQIADRFPVTDLSDRLGSFMDTAAVMMNLDLVITSDTSIAHCAGALGVPVWVALQFVPDWRWLLDRGDSPWYPTMRLFRQREIGNWGEVFDRITSELEKMIPAA